jgi:hypothetical protein
MALPTCAAIRTGSARCGFSPDGSHLASASQNRDLIVWDVRSRRPMARWDPVRTPADDLEPVSHGKAVRVLAFSPGGKVLASGGREGKTFGEGGRRGDLFLWSFLEPGPSFCLEGHTSAVSALAFSPDGSQLASADSRRCSSVGPESGRRAFCSTLAGLSLLAFDPGGSYLPLPSETTWPPLEAGSGRAAKNASGPPAAGPPAVVFSRRKDPGVRAVSMERSGSGIRQAQARRIGSDGTLRTSPAWP